MIKEVKDESLSFIVHIDEEITIINNITLALQNVTKPGDFLEKIPEYRSTIERLDSKISLDKNSITYLLSAYNAQVEQKRATLCNYCSQIEERILSQHQLNTNVTFYDEENLLSKSQYKDIEDNPSVYSMLSIVKRITVDEPSNLEYFEGMVGELQNIYKFFVDAQGYMLRIKSTFNNQEFINRFTSEYLSAETQSSLIKLQRDLSDVRLSLERSKSQIKALFQMFDAQEHDYEIYAKVVERFKNVALESYFSAGSVTSGIL